MKLFISYLGGQLKDQRIGEDHEVVLVVAENIEDAKKKSLLKWKGGSVDVHVDYIQEVDQVDGYSLKLLAQQEVTHSSEQTTQTTCV